MEWLTPELFMAAIALLTAGGSVILAIKKAPVEKADAASKFQQLASEAAEECKIMREEIHEIRKEKDDLEERIGILEAENQEWHRGVGILLGQMKEKEIVPRWTPKTQNI